MNPEPMAYESTAPPLSYLATMPKDITRNRSKSQLISPIQILIIGTTQERSLRPELAILDFFRSPRRCAPRDDRFVVGKGLDPFRLAYGTGHPIRFATKAGAAPQDKITNGTVRDRSLRQTSATLKRNGAPYPLRHQGRGTFPSEKIVMSGSTPQKYTGQATQKYTGQATQKNTGRLRNLTYDFGRPGEIPQNGLVTFSRKSSCLMRSLRNGGSR